jgi:hypothetical protein
VTAPATATSTIPTAVGGRRVWSSSPNPMSAASTGSKAKSTATVGAPIRDTAVTSALKAIATPSRPETARTARSDPVNCGTAGTETGSNRTAATATESASAPIPRPAPPIRPASSV